MNLVLEHTNLQNRNKAGDTVWSCFTWVLYIYFKKNVFVIVYRKKVWEIRKWCWASWFFFHLPYRSIQGKWEIESASSLVQSVPRQPFPVISHFRPSLRFSSLPSPVIPQFSPSPSFFSLPSLIVPNTDLASGYQIYLSSHLSALSSHFPIQT